MIKITYYSDNYCTVLLEVEPIRPARIYEYKLGETIAKKSNDYCISKEEKPGAIFRKKTSVPTSASIEDLKALKEEAQEEFSQSILKLKKNLDQFKLLKELTEKEEKKTCKKSA